MKNGRPFSAEMIAEAGGFSLSVRISATSK